jgi:hypothetical protein
LGGESRRVPGASTDLVCSASDDANAIVRLRVDHVGLPAWKER